MTTRNIFLTAEWRNLLMVNYAIDPAILKAHVPYGTELDTWNGTVYVSAVAFNFLNTKVKGIAIPFHRNFEEINLRFYVRRKDGSEWKRGVVFLKEIVPKPAIALVARFLYNENYVALPTRHIIQSSESPNYQALRVRYEWRFKGQRNFIEATGHGPPQPLEEGSEEQFISEHYWGYSMQKNGGTKEYEVEHPSWNTWNGIDTKVSIDVAGLYGAEFADALSQELTSVFIADGSAVTVSEGENIQE